MTAIFTGRKVGSDICRFVFIIMRVSLLSGGLAFALLIHRAISGDVYQVCDTIIGNDFYEAFEFEAIPDPTHGRVYVVWPRRCCPSADAT